MQNKSSHQGVQLADWQVFKDQNLLIGEHQQVTLLPKVMVALSYFIDNPKRVITFDELNQAIWPDEVVGDNSIYNLIGQLRKSLGDSASNPKYIETISKKGYRLIADVTTIESQTQKQQDKEPSPENSEAIDSSPSTGSALSIANPVPDDSGKHKRPFITWPVISGIVLVLFISISGYLFQQEPSSPNVEITTSEGLPKLANQFLALARYHQYKSGKENKLLAIDYYEKIVALAPAHLPAHLELAYLNIELMSLISEDKALFYRKAQRWAQAAESINEQHTSVIFLSELLKHYAPDSKGNTEIPIIFEQLEHNNAHPSTSELVAFAQLQFKNGLIEQAINKFEEAVKGCTNCATVHLKLAHAYMVNMALDKASEAFSRYHELNHYDENNPVKLSSQGAITLKTLKSMYQWYKKSPKAISKPYQLNHQTLLYLNMGLFEQAIELTRKRKIEAPSSYFTLYTLAAVAGAQGDFESSLRYLKRRHELYPHNPLFAQSLSIAHWMQGDNKTALSILQDRVLANSPEPSDYNLLLATLLKANGDNSQAKRILLAEQNRFENLSQLTLNDQLSLAVIYAQLGEKEKAIAALTSLVDNGWVGDFNLNWWRIEDNPFLAPIRQEKAFKALIENYYKKLGAIADE